MQPDQIDILNEVDQVCVDKNRKQSAEENIWTPWNNGSSHKELHSFQMEDPDIGPIFKWKECDSRPDRVELVITGFYVIPWRSQINSCSRNFTEKMVWKVKINS